MQKQCCSQEDRLFKAYTTNYINITTVIFCLKIFLKRYV